MNPEHEPPFSPWDTLPNTIKEMSKANFTEFFVKSLLKHMIFPESWEESMSEMEKWKTQTQTFKNRGSGMLPQETIWSLRPDLGQAQFMAG